LRVFVKVKQLTEEDGMQISHPLLIKAAARIATWTFRLWFKTLRLSYHPLGPEADPRRQDLPERYIYAFWHENLLLPAFRYSVAGAQVLISKSSDGQLIAEICRCQGFEPVRGSSSRGSVEAVRQILRVGQTAHVGVTPDGPRGPRRRVQMGVVYLAARSGLPIMPTGFGFERPWRLKSWDRFAVARPGKRATCVTLDPIVVPADAEKEALERFRKQLENALGRVQQIAEDWAETGQRPENT
jgi:lysophospholipid acyltransferase (LPLAT)-like uncharacterized protein